MNDKRTSIISRRTVVGNGSRAQVSSHIGDESIIFRTSSILRSSKLFSCGPLNELYNGGEAFSVAAQTTSTLSVKNMASPAALTPSDDGIVVAGPLTRDLRLGLESRKCTDASRLKRAFASATKNLHCLHWLPVQYRIRNQICSQAYQSHTSNVPSYISQYLPTRSLRSADIQLLTRSLSPRFC